MSAEKVLEIFNGVYFIVTAMFLMSYLFCVRFNYVHHQRGRGFILLGAFIILLGMGFDLSAGGMAQIGDEVIEPKMTFGGIFHLLSLPIGCISLLIGFWIWIPYLNELRKMKEEHFDIHQIYEKEKEKVVKSLEEKSLECARIRRKLEVAEQTKRRFLSNISHEFRTPISAISGSVDMLLETDLNAEQRTGLLSIQNANRNLMGVMDSVIELASMETTDFKLQEKVFDFEQVFENLYLLHKDLMAEKGLEFLVDISPNFPKDLVGDSGRLSQALSHLLANALKFTKNGTVTLQAEIEKETDEDLQVLLKVKDTGVGIEKEKQPYIFDLFSQDDHEEKSVYGGFGIGLGFVKKVVTLMGGVCGVESEVGQGSTFYIKLILKKIHAPQHDEILSVSEAKRLSELSILVVDDQDINLLVTSGILRKIGIQHIETALSGVEALKKMKTGEFDMVLMDCQMPEMDGLETTARYREISGATEGRGRLPIVALTANVMHGMKENCLKAGMDDYMSKPSSIQDFKNIIYKWVYGFKPSTD